MLGTASKCDLLPVLVSKSTSSVGSSWQAVLFTCCGQNFNIQFSGPAGRLYFLTCCRTVPIHNCDKLWTLTCFGGKLKIQCWQQLTICDILPVVVWQSIFRVGDSWQDVVSYLLCSDSSQSVFGPAGKMWFLICCGLTVHIQCWGQLARCDFLSVAVWQSTSSVGVSWQEVVSEPAEGPKHTSE